MRPRRSAIAISPATARSRKRCHQWLEERTGCAKALLTHSCTAALEMAALLLDLRAGDEVIMPSYTFVSTANAFVLRGAVPVFVDIRADTLNLDERLIEAAITPRTRAICRCTTPASPARWIRSWRIARAPRPAGRRGRRAGHPGQLQGPPARRDRRPRQLSASTKPRTSSPAKAARCWSTIRDLVERAEIIREKGTNRGRFFRGEVDKYTWVDVGSSFLPSEITAAFLWAQLEEAERITARADGDLAPLSRHAGAARAAGPASPPDRARRIASTTATCTTCCCHRAIDRQARAATTSRATASTRCSTTYRCILRRPGCASAARMAICR